MKRKFFVSVVLLITVIGCTALEFQNDTFYSIKIGEDIFKYGVDFLDHHSFHSLAYSYPHLIFDSIVYIVYNYLGFKGLYILTILFGYLLSIIIYKILYKLSSNYVYSLIFAILSILFMKNFLCLRAQIVSLSIFALEYYLLYSMVNKEKNKNKYSMLLFILGVILVNVHVATYPFYLIMFIPFIIASNGNRNAVISFILCLLCGLVSVMGVSSYSYLINTLLNSTTYYIEEHGPLIMIERIDYLILYVLIIWFMFSNKFKINLYDKLILMGTMFMALVSIRHGMLLSLYALIIIGSSMGKYALNKEKDVIKRVEKWFDSKSGMVIMVIVVGIFSVLSYRGAPCKKFINDELYPTGAVSYIKNKLDYGNIRIFNDINVGSYLMLNDIPVFIDSRTDLYTYTYNKKHDIFDDYIGVIRMGYYYEDVFNYYDIDYVLIPVGTSLDVYLKKDSKYKVVYEDNNFVLWERNV